MAKIIMVLCIATSAAAKGADFVVPDMVFCSGKLTCTSRAAVEQLGANAAEAYIQAEDDDSNVWHPNDELLLDTFRVMIQQCPSTNPNYGQTIYVYDYTVFGYDSVGEIIGAVRFDPVTLVQQTNSANCAY